jgi:hypothetical protein
MSRGDLYPCCILHLRGSHSERYFRGDDDTVNLQQDCILFCERNFARYKGDAMAIRSGRSDTIRWRRMSCRLSLFSTYRHMYERKYQWFYRAVLRYVNMNAEANLYSFVRNNRVVWLGRFWFFKMGYNWSNVKEHRERTEKSGKIIYCWMGVTDIKTQRRSILMSTQIRFFLLNQYKVHIVSADLVQCARSVRVVSSTHCHRIERSVLWGKRFTDYVHHLV